MGPNLSHPDKEPGQFSGNEYNIGLVNFGNTCYCNSVLQALYFCKPFREMVLNYKAQTKNQKKENLLTCLCDLFHTIAIQKKKGSIPPKKFIQRLRKENVLFDNYMQHDAHEFFNYLLNTIADILQGEKANKKTETNKLDNTSLNDVINTSNHSNSNIKTNSSSNININNIEINQNGNHSNQITSSSISSSSSSSSSSKPEVSWIHDIFQGTFTSETRCLNCETVRSREEDFLDLSIEIEQNSSITHCLGQFSGTEMLNSECKYYCEVCSTKQEAQKRMRIKRLPLVLALHLKRFKLEQPNRSMKLSYRVVFPLELRLFNTSDDASNPERMYDLVSVVIHCGSGLSRGHYICIVKSKNQWFLFDDDIVEKIEVSSIEDFYGLTSDLHKSSESGYILFYQSRE